MYFLGCLFIDLTMSYIKLVKGKNQYKQSLKDVYPGTYVVLFNDHYDYFLFDNDCDKDYDKLKYAVPRYRLNEYISSLIHEIIYRWGDYYYKQHSDIISKNKYYNERVKFICEQKDNYKKIFYLEKGSYKSRLYDSNNDNLFNWYEDNILKLEPNNEYIIYDFEKTKYGNII